MEIRLLGTVEARDGDVVVPLGPRQQRLVLGLLAWEANRPVSLDRLIAHVWPEDPPRSAAHAIRVAVSGLRSRLSGVVLEAQGTGYLLRCDPMAIDVHRFLALVAQARTTADDQDRLAVLDEALGLWRGPVLADVAPDQTFGAGVEEARLVAVEDRADVLLRLGRHRDVVVELLGLVGVHPARERLVGPLMLALYRGGRASQALEVFRRTRAYLAEELGIDPGAELRRLELAILRNDAELDPPVVAEPTLIGRRPELAQLAEWRAKAASGRAVVVLLEGVAGIGKSTLLDEFGRGGRVLRGQGVAEEGAPAYWPWRQVFRQWLGETEPTVAAEMLGDAADKIARIVPEIRRLAGAERSAEPTAEERFALFDAVTEVVGRIAVGGLVIVIDDLHWADPASLRLFSHLARGAASAPLLLVGAFRPYEMRQVGRGDDVLAEVTRLAGVCRLELAGLSVDEVAQQLTVELGRPCELDEAAAVARRTGGNPLFVREIGRLRRIDLDEVPAGARDAIRQHLRALTPSCRSLLTTASVLSVDIDPVALAAVSGVEIEETLTALDEAVAASVVLPGFRFAHDLVRESLMLDLGEADRARIHLHAAEFFEGRKGHPAQIARHRLAALPLGDPALAVRAAVRAAEQAMTHLAYEDAAHLYDQALTAGGRPHMDLLIGKATAQYLCNDVEPARRTCEEAADLARRTGDAEGLGRAALVMPEQADPLWLPTIRPWCDQALAGLPPEDSLLRAKLLALRTVIDTMAGATDDAVRTGEAAVAMAERLGDPATVIATLRARRHANSGPDGVHVRLAVGDRTVALAGEPAALWGHLWRFDALMQLGRVHEAEVALDRFESARIELPLAQWYLALARASVLQGRGRFADAFACLDRASQLAERGDNPHGVAATEIVRAYYRSATGVGDSVPEMLLRGFASSVMARLTLATLFVAFEDLDRAREHYQTLPPVDRAEIQEWYRLTVYGQYAQIAAALGDPDGASAAYERLLPYAELHMTNGANVALTGGSVHHYLGLAAAAAGRVDTAVDHFRSAVAANAGSGLLPRVAESRHRLALVLLDRGEQAEALSNAKEARAIAVRLGMPRLLARTTWPAPGQAPGVG
ncbi:BTAD domain-containing putative transcriptional regulator [Kutzneria sp. CA-103260]|uniref:BTAD domain-containing putative transcriptional regulator n=1 Tax=Kutzneria sp. CA-103260 TaxID=2802641 RepID=UPI001BA66726|nr:BTAD domain-containing putative transcriptional regulator [Kutzneria sp. CA-103260]QUQ64721.1 Bacterial transcriptional activator domain protein [Kutzneria sp. CA-103260]